MGVSSQEPDHRRMTSVDYGTAVIRVRPGDHCLTLDVGGSQRSAHGVFREGSHERARALAIRRIPGYWVGQRFHGNRAHDESQSIKSRKRSDSAPQPGWP